MRPAEQAAAVSKLKEMVQKQLDDAKSSRVSPEEAKRMEELTEALKKLEQIEKQNANQNE
jgi:CRISPR/Cas system-associated protein Csm6